MQNANQPQSNNNNKKKKLIENARPRVFDSNDQQQNRRLYCGLQQTQSELYKQSIRIHRVDNIIISPTGTLSMREQTVYHIHTHTIKKNVYLFILYTHLQRPQADYSPPLLTEKPHRSTQNTRYTANVYN